MKRKSQGESCRVEIVRALHGTSNSADISVTHRSAPWRCQSARANLNGRIISPSSSSSSEGFFSSFAHFYLFRAVGLEHQQFQQPSSPSVVAACGCFCSPTSHFLPGVCAFPSLTWVSLWFFRPPVCFPRYGDGRSARLPGGPHYLLRQSAGRDSFLRVCRLDLLCPTRFLCTSVHRPPSWIHRVNDVTPMFLSMGCFVWF